MSNPVHLRASRSVLTLPRTGRLQIANYAVRLKTRPDAASVIVPNFQLSIFNSQLAILPDGPCTVLPSSNYWWSSPSSASSLALLLPAVNSARESGRRTQCLNNLRQIGMAIQAYAEANNDVFPLGSTNTNEPGFVRLYPAVHRPGQHL